MKYLLNTPLAIHQLGQRQNQEDSIYPAYGQADASQRLFILCDGMGGHSHGEVASGIVCQEVSKFVQQVASSTRAFSDAMLTAAMESMYNVLDANDDGSGKTMGTTMVFLFFHPGGVMAAHVGDSRYYHIRPSTHEILYRSRDHSLVTELYEAGEIKLEEMATAKGKNVIMRAVMPNKEERAMPDIVHIKDVQPGDWFYMCSDGMLEQMSDQEILNIFANESLTPEQKRDCLIAATDDNHDNHTAYLIRVEAVEHDAIDAAAPDDEQEARLRNKALLATFGIGPFAETDTTTAEAIVDDVQTNTTVPPSTEEVVVEAINTSETENVSVVSSTTPVGADKQYNTPPAPRNNGKLYIVIGVLAAVIVLLMVCLLVFNKNSKKGKAEPIPIRSTVTYPKTNEDDWGIGDDEASSESGTVSRPSKRSIGNTSPGGSVNKSQNKTTGTTTGSASIPSKKKKELANGEPSSETEDGSRQVGGVGMSEDKSKGDVLKERFGTKPKVDTSTQPVNSTSGKKDKSNQ